MSGRAPRAVVRVLYALVPLALLLAATEGLLALAGVGGRPAADLVLGFDPAVRYLVPDPDVPGGWRTQYRESEDQEVVVPPKGMARRVLLLGGSNTQTFPEAALQQALNEGDPDGPGWEVVNLGRQGYASQRVAILLAQALVLEPDLIVVYSGHNEFVEAGFAAELDEQYGGAGLRALADRLAGLRSFRLLSAALAGETVEPEPAPLTGRRPDEVDKLDPAEREIPWEQTLARYDAYEHNLRAMVALAREADVPIVLCTVVSNLLSPPHVATLEAGVDEATRDELDALLRQGEMRIPRQYRLHLRPPRRLRLSTWYRGRGQVDPPPELPWSWEPSGFLADLGATAGVEHKALSMEGAHWPPPRLWEPRVLEVLTTLEQVMTRPVAGVQVRALEEARGRFQQVLARVPDHPMAHYDLGLVQWLLGEDDAAVASLRRAQSCDRSPHGGNDRSNAVVQRVAEDEGVPLFDAQQLVSDCVPAGLVGYEVVLDSCHLAPGARVALLRELGAWLLDRYGDGR